MSDEPNQEGGGHTAPPSVAEVFEAAENLLRTLEAVPPDYRQLYFASGRNPENRYPLPHIHTEAQAASWLAGIYGGGRFESNPQAEVEGAHCLDALRAFGEILAAPSTSSELLALMVLGTMARQAWRVRESVRDPQCPTVVRLLPQLPPVEAT